MIFLHFEKGFSEKSCLSKIGCHCNFKVNQHKPTTSNFSQLNLWKSPEVSGRLPKCRFRQKVTTKYLCFSRPQTPLCKTRHRWVKWFLYSFCAGGGAFKVPPLARKHHCGSKGRIWVFSAHTEFLSGRQDFRDQSFYCFLASTPQCFPRIFSLGNNDVCFY